MKSLPDFSKITKKTGCRFILDHHDLLLDITDNMDKWGGSFVKSLAEPIRRADPTNKTKLVHMFYHYLVEYTPDKWAKKGGE